MLRHFRKRTNSTQLIKDVAHSNKHGAFTIGIAHALAKAGLRVRFHTDVDPDPKPLERRLYRMAERHGAAILPAVSVATLLASVRDGSIPIVFYNVVDGSGHFSPLLGVQGRKLLLPHDNEGGMSLTKFAKAWSASEVCRQAVVVDAA